MKSIAMKLWTGMMALVLFVLVLLWLFQVVFLESFYLDTQIGRLSDRIDSLASDLSNLERLEGLAGNPVLAKELETFSFTYNLFLQVTGSTGVMIYEAGSTGEQRVPNSFARANSEVVLKALAGESARTTVEHPRFGTEFIIMAVPVAGEEAADRGALLVNMPLAPVSETSGILRTQLAYITVILLIAASAISYLISRRMTRPILSITDAATEISKGNFEARVRETGKDEIGVLARKINEMGGELGRTDRLRKELIGNISHELRTPLSLIRGYAETIRDVSGADPVRREKHVGIIIDESERLGRLVGDILSLSRIEAGAVKLEKRCFSPAVTLERVKQGFEDLAERQGIRLTIEADRDVLVLGDEDYIGQVLYNLIGNAFQHTGASGEVRAVVREAGETVRVEIRDNGEGIRKEDLDSIWDRYYKGDTSLGKASTGTGLGLAIVRSILIAHEAEFGVDSTVSEGTTFWFVLSKCP
jgi:signal transduction histidine kinase